MSMNLLVKGTFKNNKTRCIGVHNPLGMEFNNQFCMDDIRHLERIAELGDKCFNWNLENNKFKKVTVKFLGSYCNNHEEGLSNIEFEYDIDLQSRRLDVQSIIDDVNAEILNKEGEC